jgi:hypothetical protein
VEKHETYLKYISSPVTFQPLRWLTIYYLYLHLYLYLCGMHGLLFLPGNLNWKIWCQQSHLDPCYQTDCLARLHYVKLTLGYCYHPIRKFWSYLHTPNSFAFKFHTNLQNVPYF